MCGRSVTCTHAHAQHAHTGTGVGGGCGSCVGAVVIMVVVHACVRSPLWVRGVGAVVWAPWCGRRGVGAVVQRLERRSEQRLRRRREAHAGQWTHRAARQSGVRASHIDSDARGAVGEAGCEALCLRCAAQSVSTRRHGGRPARLVEAARARRTRPHAKALVAPSATMRAHAVELNVARCRRVVTARHQRTRGMIVRVADVCSHARARRRRGAHTPPCC
jgi:hypothetical protein